VNNLCDFRIYEKLSNCIRGEIEKRNEEKENLREKENLKEK
jgi:hypothetical protein